MMIKENKHIFTVISNMWVEEPHIKWLEGLMKPVLINCNDHGFEGECMRLLQWFGFSYKEQRTIKQNKSSSAAAQVEKLITKSEIEK